MKAKNPNQKERRQTQVREKKEEIWKGRPKEDIRDEPESKKKRGPREILASSFCSQFEDI